MPRVKKTDPSVRVEVQLPTSVHTKVQEKLFSPLEGRVPFGAMSDLATSLFRDWVKKQEEPLDVG